MANLSWTDLLEAEAPAAAGGRRATLDDVSWSTFTRENNPGVDVYVRGGHRGIIAALGDVVRALGEIVGD